MKKLEIAKQLARQSQVSQGEAADRLDLMVQRIVAELRKGGEVSLPGLGKLHYGPDGRVAFERDGGKNHA